MQGTIFQYLEDLPAGAVINASIASDVPLGSGLSSSVRRRTLLLRSNRSYLKLCVGIPGSMHGDIFGVFV